MFAESTVVGKGTNLQVKHGDDSGLWVEFYNNKIHQRPFIKVRVPGDNKTEWDRPVKEKDKQRFSKQWEAFNQQRSQYGEQTMLEQWEGLNDGQIRNLKAFNVQTVEQLANLTDGLIDRVGMGTRDLVRKANAWIESASSQAKEQALSRALQASEDKLALQAQQIAEMQAQMQSLLTASPEAKPKRAYTRKPKE
jgi:hypothetical protein